MQILGKDNSGRGFIKTERRAGSRHYALCFCPPKEHITTTQPEETSWWKPDPVSDNIHCYSSSLAAPVSADPNSCQANKYSLQCFEFSSIEFAMQLESLYLTWFMCKSFLWAHSWVHVLSVLSSIKTHKYVLKPCYIFHTQGAILFANSREGKRWSYGDETKDWSEHTLRQG